MGKKDYSFSPCVYNDGVLTGNYDILLKDAPHDVLDIGAHEGGFTAWVRGKWPQARVFAYEPIPENQETFRKNHSDDANVHFYPLAVSPDESFEMRYGKNNSGQCSRYDIGEQNGKVVSVKAINPVKLPSCHFVKIDTEGCEVEILKGLDLEQTHAIAIEYHRDSDIPILKDIAANHGFDLVQEIPICQDRGLLKFRKAAFAPTDNLDLCKKNLFVALPVYRVMDVFTVQSLIGLVCNQLTKQEFGAKIKMHVGECPIGRCRNDLTHEFLQTDCTHILFIDSDIIFSYDQIKKILSHPEDIVGGFYVKKNEGSPAPVCNSLGSVSKPNERGLIEAKYMGTGFLRISRRVFEVMREKLGEQIAYTDDRDGRTTKYDYWRMGVALDSVTQRKRWLSEDWQFCQFAIDCGFKVWADASILLQHSGLAVYPLRSQLPELYSSEQLERMGIKTETKTIAI